MLAIIVDDSPSVLSFLRAVLAKIENCTVHSFVNPLVALADIKASSPDLIIVDYTMPEMNGIDLVKAIRKHGPSQDCPIVMLTSESAKELKLVAMEVGVTEFLNKPVDVAELTVRVRNLMQLRRAQIVLAERAASLEMDVKLSAERLERQEEEIIWRLSRAISCRDGETSEHLTRVAETSRLIAEELGIDQQHSRMIYLASPLHDVGKIGIRDAVLLKPGPLTEEERRHMRLHAGFGAEILRGSSSELIQMAEKIAAGHHEKWNGTGYPNGLSGANIPLEARIVAVADVFDALCSERPYKAAWPLDIAFQEIVNGSGRDFDPACVAAFCRNWLTIKSLYENQPVKATLSFDAGCAIEPVAQQSIGRSA
jgi:putative two-component system response regulator